jgi:peptidoglycan/xylan/chitin deacetylase (PgdA/CDA1 family)
MFVLGLGLSACTGAHGVEPDERTRLPDPATRPGATLVGPIDRPRLVLIRDPVAVPSTTTSPAPPGPSTTTTPTTTPAATTSAPPQAEGLESSEPAPGTVALTFDDGPFENWTPILLDVLDAYGVKATFFVSTYRLPAEAALIPEILARGHSVQSHGDRHENLTRKTEEEIRLDLTTSIEKLIAAGAPRPTCFRPPYGSTNETVDSVAAELGLTVIGWSLNSLDYSEQDAARVTEITLEWVEDGDVILAHDQWAPIWETALPAVIEGVSERGLGFSPLCLPAP